MSRKSFKKSARESVASAFFSQQDTEDTQGTEDVQGIKDTHNTEGAVDTAGAEGGRNTVATKATPSYRINLRLEGGHREYLDQVSWENRVSITQYMNDLIEKDKEAYEKENAKKKDS